MVHSPPIKIFYHIYAIEGEAWKPIVKSQLLKLEYSGLLDECKQCYFTVVGPEYKSCIEVIAHHHHPSFEVLEADPEDSSFERIMLLTIHQFCEPGENILYLHSKGVTKPENPNIEYWRGAMEWFLVKNYKRCLEKLQSFDCVGILGRVEPLVHFSGNFWWTTSDYYLSLPKYISFDDYFAPEFYLLQNHENCRFLSLYESGIIDHYEVSVPPRLFRDPSLPSQEALDLITQFNLLGNKKKDLKTCRERRK